MESCVNLQMLICAATVFEIKPLIAWVEENNRKDIDICITGVGLLESTYQITKAILEKKPGFVLQAGIGGCFDERYSLSSVVAVSTEMVADMGVMEQGKFKTIFDMGFIDGQGFPYTNGLLVNPKIDASWNLETVKGVTVNEISTNHERISHLEKSGAVVESMEGAALHFCALKEKIPFLQMRAISNYVGERDKSKWQIRKAINELNRIIINKLSN